MICPGPVGEWPANARFGVTNKPHIGGVTLALRKA